MASSTCSMAVTRTPLQMQAPRRAASVAALPARRPLRVVAAQQKNQAAAPVMATALLTTAAAFAASPAAQAAQEAFQVAEGEPLIVVLGWCATAAMFSFSLAMVVWGRSGL